MISTAPEYLLSAIYCGGSGDGRRAMRRGLSLLGDAGSWPGSVVLGPPEKFPVPVWLQSILTSASETASSRAELVRAEDPRALAVLSASVPHRSAAILL